MNWFLVDITRHDGSTYSVVMHAENANDAVIKACRQYPGTKTASVR